MNLPVAKLMKSQSGGQYKPAFWAGHMLLVHVAILLHKAGMQELQQAKRNTGSCFAVCCVPVFSERAFLMTRGGGQGVQKKPLARFRAESGQSVNKCCNS